MPTTRRPVTTFSVGEYLEDEMRERGWGRDDLALYMGGDFGQQRLIVDMILELRDDPNILLDDDTAAALGLALGTSAALWKRIHDTHRAAIAAVTED